MRPRRARGVPQPRSRAPDVTGDHRVQMLFFLLLVRQKVVAQKPLHVLKADAGSAVRKAPELIGEASELRRFTFHRRVLEKHVAPGPQRHFGRSGLLAANAGAQCVENHSDIDRLLHDGADNRYSPPAAAMPIATSESPMPTAMLCNAMWWERRAIWTASAS